MGCYFTFLFPFPHRRVFRNTQVQLKNARRSFSRCTSCQSSLLSFVKVQFGVLYRQILSSCLSSQDERRIVPGIYPICPTARMYCLLCVGKVHTNFCRQTSRILYRSCRGFLYQRSIFYPSTMSINNCAQPFDPSLLNSTLVGIDLKSHQNAVAHSELRPACPGTHLAVLQTGRSYGAGNGLYANPPITDYLNTVYAPCGAINR